MLNKKLRLNILYKYIIYYTLMMFIVWNINIEFIHSSNTLIYNISTYILFGILLLNIDSVIEKRRFRSIYPMLLIFILSLLNFRKIGYSSRAIEYLLRDFPIFMTYILVFSTTGKKQIISVVKSLLLLISIYNILGVVGAIFKFDTFFYFIPNVLTDNYRYSSVLTNPNTYGLFAFISLVISLYFIVTSYSKKSKFINTILAIFSLASIIVSMSRSVMLMVFFLVLFMFKYFKNLSEINKKIIKYTFLAILLLVGIFSILNYEFILNFFRLNQGLNERFEIWQYVVRVIKVNWMRGYGYHNSSIIFDEIGIFPVSHAHNLYLSILLEFGVVVGMIILIYLAYTLIKSFLFLKYTTEKNNELYFIFLFLSTLLIGQFFEFSLFKISSLNYLMFTLFGVLFNFFRFIKDEGIYRKRVTHLITGLGSGGAEAMLYKVLKYRSENYNIKVISMTDLGFYGERIKSMGIKVITLDMNHKYKVLYFPFKLYYNLIKTDTLQTWLYHANFIGTIFGVFTNTDKIIWGVRQTDYSFENNSRSAATLSRLSKYISFIPTYILSNSDEVTKVHQELGYLKSRFITINNGFELDNYYFDEENRRMYRKEFNILENELLFINVARFDIQKDHNTLFKSLELLIKRYKFTNFKILLVGRDINKDNLKLINYIKESELTDYVILEEQRSDVNKILSAADIFLLSSLGEGFPNVIGEAMATSLICLATDVGDCRVILGDTGFIVSKKDPDQFSKKLYDIINMRPEEKELLKLKTRERVVDNYNIEDIVDKYEELY